MTDIIAENVLMIGRARLDTDDPGFTVTDDRRKTRSSINPADDTPSNRALTTKKSFSDNAEKIHVHFALNFKHLSQMTGGTIKNFLRIAYAKTFATAQVDMSKSASFFGVYFFDGNGQASMCYTMTDTIPGSVLQTWLSPLKGLDLPKIALVIDKNAMARQIQVTQGTKKQAGSLSYADDPDDKLKHGPVPPLFRLIVLNEKLQVKQAQKEKLNQTILDQKEQETNYKDEQINRMNEQLQGYRDTITDLRNKLSHARDVYLQPEVRRLERELGEAQHEFTKERKKYEDLVEVKKRNESLTSRGLRELNRQREESRERHAGDIEELQNVNDDLVAAKDEIRERIEELEDQLRLTRQDLTDLQVAAQVSIGRNFY